MALLCNANKTTIRKILQRDVSRLKTDINLLLKDATKTIRRQYPKRFLIIFDNLDRISPHIGEKLFFDYAAQLKDLETTLTGLTQLSLLCPLPPSSVGI
ncbi:MAG: hypothetical protein HC835_21380 [Oscillatoriales cyanobacterium RM2_1_1]|nr:hypothetical protein [Oscillatoriales cyanobacterium RM2_1_1]